MSYRYEDMREQLFTEAGVAMLMKVRDTARALLDNAGAFQAGCAFAQCTGDSWQMLACLDYLAEVGEIREIDPTTPRMGQHRIYVSGKHS